MTTPALAFPAGLPTADGYWRHEDPRGIGDGAARAMLRAERRDWTSGTALERANQFRDLLVFRSWIAGRLSGTAGASAEGQALAIAPDYETARGLANTNDRAMAVAILGRTPLVLAEKLPGFAGWHPPRLFATGPAETAAFPLVAVAIVTIVVAVAESAAVAYLAHQAAQVVDNLLARNADAKAMLEADAQALRVLDEHAARETAEGRALPLDDAEKTVLGELGRRQETLAKKKTPGIDPGILGSGGLPWYAFPLAVAAGIALYVSR